MLLTELNLDATNSAGAAAQVHRLVAENGQLLQQPRPLCCLLGPYIYPFLFVYTTLIPETLNTLSTSFTFGSIFFFTCCDPAGAYMCVRNSQRASWVHLASCALGLVCVRPLRFQPIASTSTFFLKKMCFLPTSPVH
jgi:hypothetical protein